MTWKEWLVLVLLLICLAFGVWSVYATRLAEAQCATAFSAEMVYDDIVCVVFNRAGVKRLGVPKRYRLKSMVACLADRRKSGKFASLLVFGIGKRGQLKCSGYGPTGEEYAQFEACGLLW